MKMDRRYLLIAVLVINTMLILFELKNAKRA